MVALAVDPSAKREAVFTVASWRDVGPGAALVGEAANVIRAASAIGEQDRVFSEIGEQRQGLGAIMGLAW